MPPLTPKQLAFVHGLLEGKSGSDAYRATYNCANASDRTIWAEASRLRCNPKVAAWLQHCQRIELCEARITLAHHLAELARVREEAIAHCQIGAGVHAEHLRGKAAGFYMDRLRLTAGPTDAELIKAIEELVSEEMSKQIGAALGAFS